jgi:hypothetical protein
MSQPPFNSPPDRLIDAEKAQRIPQSWREEYLRRSVDKLPADVVHLYDLTWKQMRENDLKARVLLLQQAELDRNHRSLLINWLVTIAQIAALATALIKVFWLR